MADYITKSILFEAYVHIDIHYESETEAIESVKQEINNYMKERSEHFLYKNVETEVSFKEGSLKAYATVMGTLRESLGVYENFSNAVNGLLWFSKRLSDAAVMEVAFQTGSYIRAIERTEARPGVVGLTKRINDILLSLISASDNDAAKRMLKNMRTCQKDINRLLAALYDEGDIKLVKKEFKSILGLSPTEWRVANVSEENKESYKYERDIISTLIS